MLFCLKFANDIAISMLGCPTDDRNWNCLGNFLIDWQKFFLWLAPHIVLTTLVIYVLIVDSSEDAQNVLRGSTLALPVWSSLGDCLVPLFFGLMTLFAWLESDCSCTTVSSSWNLIWISCWYYLWKAGNMSLFEGKLLHAISILKSCLNIAGNLEKGWSSYKFAKWNQMALLQVVRSLQVLEE